MDERTLVIFKPDAVNRALIGEILHRFERKGFKIVGMKMSHLSEQQLGEHYAHHKSKPFFQDIVKFMRSAPAMLLVLEGKRVIEVVRQMAGPTHGVEASPGTIRGDYALSISNNIVHASDSKETAKTEIARFFSDKELFDYERIDSSFVYADDERA
ncbi:MAG TPA: nucleoside-diphosphate kinase [Candidatus Nanoarchaeia archaeon]|nr:nucleoside-diphosphate kinase [Candidatus Nanoarchaeia archaeon]